MLLLWVVILGYLKARDLQRGRICCVHCDSTTEQRACGQRHVESGHLSAAGTSLTAHFYSHASRSILQYLYENCARQRHTAAAVDYERWRRYSSSSGCLSTDLHKLDATTTCSRECPCV